MTSRFFAYNARAAFDRPFAQWGLPFLWLSMVACSASHHGTQPSALGSPVDRSELATIEASLSDPGPIQFTRVVAADWQVARSGLVNLDHPRAREAGLEDALEDIEIYFYVLEHPEQGDYLVDSGVSAGFRGEGRNPAVSALVEAVMNTESLVVHHTTEEWLGKRERPLAGVFLTHLHLDHVMGFPDIPSETPVYVGPGEAAAQGFLNIFSRGTIDQMLVGKGKLQTWPFPLDRGEDPVGLVDVFGDASLWALHVPGHTPGSTAFLVRTTEGAKLLVGDASHTVWGWENGVEPGTFTANHEGNAKSLLWLREFAASHPEVEVHLGHQRDRANP